MRSPLWENGLYHTIPKKISHILFAKNAKQFLTFNSRWLRNQYYIWTLRQKRPSFLAEKAFVNPIQDRGEKLNVVNFFSHICWILLRINLCENTYEYKLCPFIRKKLVSLRWFFYTKKFFVHKKVVKRLDLVSVANTFKPSKLDEPCSPCESVSFSLLVSNK